MISTLWLKGSVMIDPELAGCTFFLNVLSISVYVPLPHRQYNHRVNSFSISPVACDWVHWTLCVRKGDHVESTRNLSLLFSVTNILAQPKAIKFMLTSNVIMLFFFFIGITGDENYSISFNFFLFIDCSDNIPVPQRRARDGICYYCFIIF